MTIQFNVLSNLDEVDVWLKELGTRGLSQATKSTMIRTKPTMKKESLKMVKLFRKTQSKKITDRFKFFSRFQGSDFRKYEVEMRISRKPIRLLHFIKGKKEAQKQKGISAKRRRKLKAEVVPGRVTKLRKAFIQKGKGGSLLVFQRQGEKSLPLRVRTGAFIHHLFAKPELTKPIEKNTGIKMTHLFRVAINNKMRIKLPKGNVKKE